YAKEHGLKLLQPESIRTPEIEALLAESAPDVVIVAAYGRIIPDALLKMPKYGYINVHASLLPKYRGAAPIQWALRNGDAETGVSIMKLESGLDEGPVYKMAKLAIAPEWNKKDLFDALAVLGADCLLETLAEIDSLSPVAQDHANATYAPMFGKQDGCIDFAQPAKVLVDLSRALEPDDSIYTFINNKRIAFKSVAISDNIENKSAVPGTVLAVSKKSIDIATGDGALHVTEVQPAGKKPMAIQSFLNGHPLQVGDRFLIES
ncbi:MAG: methionyl-tRNA formyltransferase, partial [Peptococcaceae bacterium]|nr:methionyl-tRNA formyltransferase [Peptococcaceae bacterium]